MDESREHAFPTAGRPTCMAAAPYATKYHATASQTLRVSEYITQPFLLERIKVELPVHAYKDFGGDALSNFTSAKYRGGSGGQLLF